MAVGIEAYQKPTEERVVLTRYVQVAMPLGAKEGPRRHPNRLRVGAVNLKN